MNAKYVYFIGIGGIGMSALARWFKANGFEVAGYDKTPTDLTNELQREGIAVHFEDDVEQIPAHFRADKAQCLVVYTPAVPKDHRELNYLQAQGFQLQKRSQVLGLLTKHLFTIAVAGTHGKTTTSSMVAHVLKQAGKNVTAFLGGITQNYGTNLLLNDKPAEQEPIICVVEADEYDRSFLTLHPNIAVVNSIDPDHLDIYGNHEAVQESFRDFVQLIKPNGSLFIKQGINLPHGNTAIRQEDFSLGQGDYYAENVRIEEAQFKFDAVTPLGRIEGMCLLVPGFHNVENALAATAVGLRLGIAPDVVRQALASYQGVKRRFQYIVKNEDFVFVDDYAHHPAEIEAFLKSLRALYPNKEITAVFQPHLFSRTRDFADGFAESLSLADRLVLLEIYPAREQPIEGISSRMLLNMIDLRDKSIVSKEQLPALLKKMQPQVLATMGAGDIDQCVEPIRNMLIC